MAPSTPATAATAPTIAATLLVPLNHYQDYVWIDTRIGQVRY
jgi:hypothetical protein